MNAQSRNLSCSVVGRSSCLLFFLVLLFANFVSASAKDEVGQMTPDDFRNSNFIMWFLGGVLKWAIDVWYVWVVLLVAIIVYKLLLEPMLEAGDAFEKAMKSLIIFVVLIGLANTSNAVLTSKNWNWTAFSCNNLQYGVYPQRTNIMLCYSNGTSYFSNFCTTSGGALVVRNPPNNWQFASCTIAPPSNCNATSCIFQTIIFDQGQTVYCNGTGTAGDIYPMTNFPVYENCQVPVVSLLPSIPSSIMSDRYRFNFSLYNPAVWSGIYCTLNLQGSPNEYFANFSFGTNNLSSVDVLYSTYPREFTMANARCFYLNENNNSVIFHDRYWLVDDAKNYSITDLDNNKGNLTLNPHNPLYAGDILTSISFKVVDSDRGNDYNAPINIQVSSNNNLSNCSMNINYNQTLMALAPPYYHIPEYISCPAPINITTNLTAYSAASSQPIAWLYNYNISFAKGNLIIDNINLIKNANNGNNLELWATLSTDYGHNALPSNANASCNYTLLAYNYSSGVTENYTGPMATSYGQDRITGRYFHKAYNKSILTPSPWDYGTEMVIEINCTALNYNNKTVYPVVRNVGRKKLNTFECWVAGGLADASKITYLQGLNLADPAMVHCTISYDPDLNASNVTDVQITNVELPNLFKSEDYTQIYAASNVEQWEFSPCGNEVSLDIVNSSTWQNTTVAGINLFYQTVNSYIVAESRYVLGNKMGIPFHMANPFCNALMELRAKKVSTTMVKFQGYYGSNYTYNSYITPTYAYLTFDLMPRTGANFSALTLSIANNKSSLQGTAQLNDWLKCEMQIQDSGNEFSDAIMYIMESVSSSPCAIAGINPMLVAPTQYMANGTKLYSALVQVNMTNCPFFAQNNRKGNLVCSINIQRSSGGISYEASSNLLAYLTPTNTTTAENPLPELDSTGWLFWIEQNIILIIFGTLGFVLVGYELLRIVWGRKSGDK